MQCFITRWNTEKRVESTTHSGVFFDKLQGVSSGNETLWQMLDYFSNKMILEGEIKDAKNDQFFIWFPNTHLTLISFVFSLWIINEIEKKK